MGCINSIDGWSSISKPAIVQENKKKSFSVSSKTNPPNKKDPPKNAFLVKKEAAITNKSLLSRYGNPDTYRVKGCPYRVMKNATGYKMRGIASWYGAPFHRQKTSSGEIYDMYAMTAAHKTLPLPTYVKVRNLNNGREVVVKVNDRGPFYKNRIIDLSYAAGEKLGFLNKGTTLVEIEALAQNKVDANYYIQAGAFSSPQMAVSLQNKIVKLTSSPVKVEKYEKHYIVRVGPFANKKMTDHLKKKMAYHGIEDVFALLL